MIANPIVFSKEEFRLDFLDFEVRQQALRELQVRLFDGALDTRPALPTYAPIADLYQRRVVEAAEFTIRLLASAGTGKTQTLVNRVISAIRHNHGAKRILLLTFDNASVSTLRSMFKDELAKAQISPEQYPTISTINAFGYAFLREYVPEEFKSVAPDYRRRRLLREVKDALCDISPERFNLLPAVLHDRFYLDFFSLLKNEIFDPRQPDAQALADFMLERMESTSVFFTTANPEVATKVVQAVIWLYMAFELALQREKLLDSDDQKLRSYLAIKEKPALLHAIQDKYSEIIVDEFQDVNKLDFAFIQSISAASRLVVCGDDDQAIYGFRGCSPDYLINLEARLERRVASYEMTTSYRCPPNILEHATRLIRNNTRRVDKSPVAQRKEPAAIKVISTLSAGLEAKLIVSYIRRVLQASTGLLFRDVAVLYRTNAQSLPLQVEFVLNDIPYYVREEDNLLENRLLARLLSTLRVKLAMGSGQQPAPNDAVALVQSYFSMVTPEESAAMMTLFTTNGRFFEALGSEAFYTILPKARSSNLVTAIRDLLRTRTLMETLDLLSKNFTGLAGMVGSLEDVVADRLPLGEIYELAANYAGKTDDFVRMLERAVDRARQTKAGTNREGGVALLTYLRAKGNQWHTVILTTCNEGLIPHRRASIEDERRLFYVALTRASSNLLLSYVKSSCRNSVEPSRFLREAGLI